MREILLTQGRYAIIDNLDYERISRHKWCIASVGYAVRNIKLSNGKKSMMLMHREIMNTPKGIQIDHINGDKLDNRKINLRLCTQQQNNRNITKPRRHNKLGIKGVRFLESRNRFSARIRVNKKEIHLGYFPSMRSAEEAYREAELKYFGEFARKL